MTIQLFTRKKKRASNYFMNTHLLTYLRIKARVLQKKIFLEPTNTADDIMSPFLSTAASDDLQEIIKLAHMRPPNASLDVSGDEFTFDKGKDYDWSVPHYKVSTS